MEQSNIHMRVSADKKKEVQEAAKKHGVSITAYFISLHNADVRREKALNRDNTVD